MLRHEPTSSILRFYSDSSSTEQSPYDAVATVLWLSKDEVEIIGLHGRMTLALYDDLVKWLLENNIKTLRAERRDGHTMPGIKSEDGFYYLNVQQIAKKRRLI